MRKGAALAALSLSVAAPAVAAPRLPLPDRAEGWSDADYSTRETRALTHAYARCVVKRQPARASEAIARNLDNRAILRDYPMLIRGECLSRQVHQPTRLQFGGDLYRYALAEALVIRELAAQPAPDLAPVARLDHRGPGEPPQPVDSKGRKLDGAKLEAALKPYRQDSAFAFLSRYGECVVRVDTAGARALLVSAPDSADESARFGALRPALAHCLPEGETLRFGKTALRGSIAINYYRLALAARVSAGGAQR